MSITTAQDIITTALQFSRGDNPGDTPSAADLASGLDLLNLMLDSWSGRSLLTLAEIQENFPLVAGTAAYTIGASATFNTSMPFSISSAFIRDANYVDYDLDIVSREVFNSKVDKAMPGDYARPEILFYDPGATQQATQAGTINLYMAPDASIAYTLFIVSEKPLTEFASLSTSITFRPSYKLAIISNLVVLMNAMYGRTTSPEMIQTATESMRIIEAVNAANKKKISGFTFPGQKNRSYNILTGTDQP